MSGLADLVAAVDLRFVSGNEVPVERASIRKPEWDALKRAIAHQQAEPFGAEFIRSIEP